MPRTNCEMCKHQNECQWEFTECNEWEDIRELDEPGNKESEDE